MGLMRWFFGGGISAAGGAVKGVAEVFRPNAENEAQRTADYQQAALAQYAAEYTQVRPGLLNRLVDFLNRLPRPLLALGTIGLFVYAMEAPDSFAVRMQALDHVPDPLWWLLGAIVSFYFGAREAHYFRKERRAPSKKEERRRSRREAQPPDQGDAPNAALAEWSAARA
ncbi:MAG: holin family protein [Pseudomonadota bacterium]